MMSNHIVLFEPRIPQNTGNIARTAAATNATLHLIKPYGFEISEKNVRRAGLDYWDAVELREYAKLADFLEQLTENSQLHLVSKFAEKSYSTLDYDDGRDHYFLFGREDTGLPADFQQKNAEKNIRIPQNDAHVRSLNLSNAVALVIYEALRQQDFAGLEKAHSYGDKDKLK
ncbi:MAG: tRNA (cytidine(34)-2'-O)-methyltransferase [Streptococcaceae bacterium]|nr:tRNA (cytidine(34)-2'-O)-methyltransferase [Streptococcaceae bacterium]